MSNATNLMYTSINDLVQKAKINYTGKEPRNVYQRLPAMRQNSDLAKKQGDDEKAYIFLKRWLDSVEWLKRTHNKDGKSAYAASMTVEQINEAKNILADLKQKLEVRYKLNSKKCNDKVELMEVEMDESKAPNSDIGLKLPEIPAEDISLSSDSDNFISCDKLYNLIQKIRARYLIIDTRQTAHYENSRISSDRCINIPQSEIKRGLLGTHFEKYFANDKHSYDLFVNRSAQHTDILVLLDWNTTQETLTPYIHINLLKDIFEKWDPGIKHKKIKILNGGYQEWLERYPAFTTNPSIEVPEFKTVTLDEKILDTFEYPSWACSDSEEEILKKGKDEQETKSELNNMSDSNVDMEIDHGDNKSAISRHARSNSNDTISSTKSKNFVNHITISINDKRPSRSDSVNGQRLESPESPVLAHSKILSNKMPQNEVSAKPMIDRSSKPTALKTYDPRCKEVLKFMKELNELAKSKSKLATELLTQEYELYSQRENKYSLSDEKYLRTEIKSLKVKLEDMHKMYLKIENEFKTYLKETDTIKFNSTDDYEKKNLEFNLCLLNNEIKDIETKRKKLQEDFLQRGHKEILKNDSDVYKEPLKDGSSINTGLERSYSSPNLLQLGDRKAPQIDRTSKPHISPRNQNGIGNENIKVSSLSWGNREERMTPIHGTVHPGITGLKNLGNSCYMNSIIQCLSNTTNLAKYFIDNSYADDLNTNNDNITQGQVVEEVAQVIKALWRGQYKSISPYDLKVAVGQYKLQFESYEQQDSHEFLMFLLDWMHNELKKNMKMPIEMTNAEKEWDKAMNSQRSIISDLFFGQLRSTITCSFCKQASTTYETFNTLPMSLSQSNRCTLNDCMEKFVTGQKVSGWKCSKCQTPRDATKKFDFVKLAPIVVIHLHRFAESGGWLEKRNTAVDFPLTGFNLKPYLVLENTKAIMSNNIRNYNYTLYAISNHYGTMDGGHYTAFCKNSTQNKWYKYDDQTVTEVSPSQVKSQNTSAYLLFYTSFPNTIM
ncbi:PREDICTED: ubiquitin carboxyl-terminal hydrolase 8-like [Cyphomyrmex costatus]|uniref:ubiquitinyl hydrolase 1 n=1 Tax=Cyphomyrmex costatus TaxID=456900 RepID=A0A151IJ38_9HYME|nr:PREDICTED: ubiquitin carboxyl-terminal hydrolase 8-like [Cyphomyrmex costatus]KYN02885.1 Ubiquitin carboxyl-terminal hydrolase 8 [Cyphomyrmex costatus]